MQLGRVLLENNEKVVQDIFFLLIVSLLGLSGTLAFAVAWKKFLITFESLKREINGRREGGSVNASGEKGDTPAKNIISRLTFDSKTVRSKTTFL